MRSRIGRVAGAIAVICGLVAALGATAPSALAARTFDSEITGVGNPSRTGGVIPSFSGPTRVGIEANDQVRITSRNNLYKYDPYPSQTLLLPQPDQSSAWDGFGQNELSIASDFATGQLFVSEWNSRIVYSFDHNDVPQPLWDTSHGTAGHGMFIAFDNSPTYSGGRLYQSLLSPENAVEAFDAARRPVDFPASAPYITDNSLTGTPEGPFGEVGYITVDSLGNIYVVDQQKGVVDEFDSSGTFVQAFTGFGAPGGFTVPESEHVPDAVAVDPTDGNVLIETENEFQFKEEVDEFDSSGNYLGQITADPHGPLGAASFPLFIERHGSGNLDLNSAGYLYLPSRGEGEGSPVDIFTPNPPVPDVAYGPVLAPSPTGGALSARVNPNGGGEVTSCHFEYGTSTSYGSGPLPCEPATHFTTTTDVSAALSGLTTETAYHYRVVVEDGNGTKYGADQIYTPHGVVGLETRPAAEIGESSAALKASFVGDGTGTHYHFEWGPTETYGAETAETLVSPGPGSSEALSADLTGLSPYSTYHFRVVATNGTGTSYGGDRIFTTTPGLPSIRAEFASQVHADRVVLGAEVDPNGSDTTFHFEYVDEAEFEQSGFANAKRAPASDAGVGRSKHFQNASTLIGGLSPGTVYHYRTAATSQIGSVESNAGRTFETFPFGFNDTCPNSHVRQQTGSALLLDCRAYELVSARNAGGYDVESNLVAGQTPFGGYSQATGPSRFLYGVHEGAVPGSGSPTNHGLDPYIATRGEGGWTTRYVGIPADGTPSDGSFASTLAEADPHLGAFAFGGSNLCSPCFPDGSTGTPIHLPDGELVQGMAGSIPEPVAEPAGFVGRRLSADGSHFVFGSTLPFEPAGNDGEISIYDRNLASEETHVVSKTPTGQTMTEEGKEIGELDISGDGSRIVIGHLVDEVEGAKYWHLYMNVGDSTKTIDLTPGTTSGARYDGMSADGSRVFFTTSDQLTGDDEDASADIYEAVVSETQATVSRVSSGVGGGPGGPGNTDLCEPSSNTIREHWNSTGSEEDCGVVAVGGGGGVASGDGTIYFLSPELLDGSSNGVENAPNLYIARPGQPPHFVATLESSSNAQVPPAAHPFLRTFGTFLRPSGVAIDHPTGDIYVLDITNGENTGTVEKFDSSGHLVPSFGSSGKITIAGQLGNFHIAAEIAVDNAPGSPSHGDLYVPSPATNVVKKFGPAGENLGSISVGGLPSAVAVDQTNGNVYVTSSFSSEVFVFNASGTPLTNFPVSQFPTGVAVDSSGRVYVVNGEGFFGNSGAAEIYSSSGIDLGQLDGNPSKAVAVDPADDHVYVDEGNHVIEFDPSGAQVGAPIGSGLLKGSFGLTADSGNIEVSNPSTTEVASFGPAAIPPEPRVDNPLVIDSVSSPETRQTADFALPPSGEDAVFTSTLPLTGYDNAEVHREIFRYDPEGGLVCASCNPTGERATGDASLPTNGLGVTDDGRVFFNSTEGLVDRDLNNKQDAYEWESGKGIELVSTGTSALAASLVGVSADGTDAYFFTHDTLVPGDENGARVKVYDARTLGGFPIVPPPVPCSASDECHGPSTQAPPAPNIKTIAGSPVGNAAQPVKCRKGTMKVHGKCVKRRLHHHRRHNRAAQHRGGRR